MYQHSQIFQLYNSCITALLLSAIIDSSDTGIAICHKEKHNGNLSCGKIHGIQDTCFEIYRCASLWTVALKQPTFKLKKGFANITVV
jgi:hypothetical protein